MFKTFRPYQDNAVKTTGQLLKLLKVPVTYTTLKQSLKEHPDYPSLLSVMDNLSDWKVKSLGIQAKIEQLTNLPVPFIAHIRESKQEVFTVVTAIEKDKITYYHDSKKRYTTTSFNTFSGIYKGTVMLAESLENAGEAHYQQNRSQEILAQLRIPFVLLAAILLIGILIIFPVESSNMLSHALFSLLSLAGVFVTGLLLWYEVDQQNPVLHKICTAGKNTNCGAILQSNVAKLGGLISWSGIGFIYFTGGFLSLLLSGMNTGIVTLLAWLNVLAVPYVFFSIYYQWRIAKQWCVLCLTVQGLLLAELLVNLIGGQFAVPFAGLSSQLIVVLLFSFIAPGLMWSALKPLWLRAEEGKRNKTALLRLKHDPRIFEALLPKQKAISGEEVRHLGIALGNPEAKHWIIKVCNPYCGPCAKAHPEIEEIMENNPDVSARIIFTATDNEKDIRSLPARHLMAIAEKGDVHLTKQALDDWYNPPKKDYKVFADNYPLNGELQQQGEKLKAMSEWCEKTGISFTPTFFVNGYQLPDIYGVEDLKYLVE